MRFARRALATIACLGAAGCDLSNTGTFENKHVSNGDAGRGRALVASGVHGCTACHAVPGIQMPRGVAGPPLAGMARRGFIAGQLPNTPGTMIVFLQNPPALLPNTGMPNV